ncbi:MAG: alanine dehydrogenase [Rhodocyclaceae bacterium]|nr:MAG: alanine dehydrogenase [Rhodocyclaceae bacterium]TND00346.1 MAG: alanine dehydrogenase [Rhodocyclaceae bacterium]
MRIGIPAEIKSGEFRVGLVPASVQDLCAAGHDVVVQTGAGAPIGFSDADYAAAGARVVASAAEAWAAELVVKVKEPQAAEFGFLRQDQVLFTYLHLAPDLRQAEALQRAGCVAIAYETVTDRDGQLPLLAPMSAVAGRMAVQVGAHFLEKTHGGRGILLGGVPGVAPGRVTVLGTGTVAAHAVRMAVGLGAEVTVIGRTPKRLDALDREYHGRIRTLIAGMTAIEESVRRADLVIGAVLQPGGPAPKLIDRALLKTMQRGAVIVDVAIDQGGCCETSHPTTHADPVFVEEGVLHYCVANMPGAVPLTSTLALGNATLPYLRALAGKGWKQALRDDPGLAAGLNVCAGQITHRAVAEALRKNFTSAGGFFAA